VDGSTGLTMAIDFPTSPANGATLTSNGKTWQYSSATTAWSIVTDPAQIQSITSTTTSGGTTTLDSSANFHQFFTGSSAHTLVLPVVSTLSLGQYYMVHNNSTGTLTVQSSGLNAIVSMPGNTTVKCTVISTSGTTAASWDADFQGFTSITGTGAAVLSTSPTLVTPNIGAATGTSLSTTGAISTSAGTITARAAATQDGVTLQGRAGGSNTRAVTLTTATLSANQTITLPDSTGTLITTGDTGTVTSTMIADGTIANADINTNAAIDLGKLADVSTNAQVASYTLVLADKNKIVEMNNASPNNLTVPPNSSVTFPVGSQINILQTGAGQTTIVEGAGVTVNRTPGLKMRAQWSYATLIKRATDTWVLVGDISA